MKKHFPAQIIWIIIVFGILLSHCSKRLPELSDPDKFGAFISGHSTGIIGGEDEIRVFLAQDLPMNTGQELDRVIMKTYPSVSGKLSQSDQRTLVFTPDSRLKPGTEYRFQLSLHTLFGKDAKEAYVFRVKTIEADFSPHLTGYRTGFLGDTLKSEFHGEIVTSDVQNAEVVEKMLSASQDGKALAVQWNHAADRETHSFIVREVQRGNQPGKLLLRFSGKPIQAEFKEEMEVNIPALGDFSLLSTSIAYQPSQHLVLTFSDPLNLGQELKGLIELGDVRCGLETSWNTIKVFPTEPLRGKHLLKIDQGLQNLQGKALGQSLQEEISFALTKPQLRFTGAGHIVPAAESLSLPFEAINLSAVDIRIIEIFAQNIPYFLQQNDWDGDAQLKRFGRPVYKGTLSLSSKRAVRSDQWSAYNIQLDELIGINTGAMYRVELSMRPSYSLYQCPEDAEIKHLNLREPYESSFWDDPDSWYENDWFYYNNLWNWRERENPCAAAYYNPDRTISKNLIASSLGIIAKKGDLGEVQVYVTDLISSQPLQGVEVSLFNLQQNLLVSGKTQRDGGVLLKTDQTPFLLIAGKGEDRGYLKLNNANALQTSMFEVSGQAVEGGLKGFLYGERDLWRPGDSLFLSLIIAQKQPQPVRNHPLILELFNPSGQLVERKVELWQWPITTFRLATGPEAPTGNYNAVVHYGGSTFSKRIRIEAFKPNRLKIRFETDPEILRSYADEAQAKAEVKWLHGTLATDRPTVVEMKLQANPPLFKGFENYVFENNTRPFEDESREVFRGKTDQTGTMLFPLSLPPVQNAPGRMEAIINVRTEEPGGGHSSARFSRLFHPFETYAGIKLPPADPQRPWYETGKACKISLACVNTEGQGLNQEVEVQVYKLEWRWWWESSYDYLGNYVSGSVHHPVLEKKLQTVNGKASFDLLLEDSEWGRYLILAKVASGHTAVKTLYFDWPYGRRRSAESGGATMLVLSADKEKYQAGESIQLSFPSSEIGKALISVENSSGVLQSFWVDAEEGMTQVELEATAEMTPNAYASVWYIQPYAQSVNDQPLRLYGIIPLMVEDGLTRLQAQLLVPEKIRAERAFELTVSEQEGREMYYTLAIVDEGLLDISGFATPDPWNFFYAKEALGVKTWDVYDNVLGAYGGRLEQLFAVGGGQAGVLDPSRQRVQRFEPVVKFLGPFHLAAGGNTVHKIKLPQYVGSVRVMLVASDGKAHGSVDKTIEVSDPLMVLATVPRVLGTGEEISLPVSIFYTETGKQDINVKVEVAGPLQVLGSAENQVSFNKAAEKEVDFRLSTSRQEGWARITITAFYGGETASHSIDVEVRNPLPETLTSHTRLISPGSVYAADPDTGDYNGPVQTLLEISAGPPMNLGKRMHYLLQYPHGCLEQTVSAAMPQLQLIRGNYAGEEALVKARKHIDAALEKLRTYAISPGSFSYWPGGDYYAEWSSIYAGHFMLEAEQAGFSLPQGLKSGWLGFEKRAATRYQRDLSSQTQILTQAYRLYVLALAGQAEQGAMNRLRESVPIPPQARWMLALAYAVSGRSDVARDWIDLRETKLLEYEQPGSTFGSAIRDKAILLELLSLLKMEQQALDLAMEISEELCSEKWMSTQSTGFALAAMIRFNQMHGAKGKQASILLTVNGKQSRLDIQPGQAPYTQEVKGAQPIIRIENSGNENVFFTLTRRGKSLRSFEKNRSEGLRLNLRFTDKDLNPISIDELVQGSEFQAQVQVINTGYRPVENIALTQIFPAGWEILNERIWSGETQQKGDYQDIRDDRVMQYFDLNMGGSRSFTVKLTAAYAGVFYYPGAVAEAMYDARFRANTAGREIRVVRREKP